MEITEEAQRSESHPQKISSTAERHVGMYGIYRTPLKVEVYVRDNGVTRMSYKVFDEVDKLLIYGDIPDASSFGIFSYHMRRLFRRLHDNYHKGRMN